jgi:ribonuclease P protein component
MVGTVSAEEAMGEANISAEHPQAVQEARFSAPYGDPRRAGDLEGPPPEGPASPVGLIRPIRDRATFDALRSGRRVRSGALTVSFIEGNPAEPPRVAYAIGRKVGGAVERNRLRRRLRAVVREHASRLRPGAYLIAAAPMAARMPFGELQATLIKTLEAMGDTTVPVRRGARHNLDASP